MENWMIGARLVILLYCIFSYVRGDMKDIPLVVLLMLVYTSSSAASYIFRRAVIRRAFKAVTAILLIAGAGLTEPLFILLSVIDILELVSEFSSGRKYYFVFLLIPPVFAGVKMLPEYIAFGLMSLLIYKLVHSYYESNTALKKENQRLRDRNEELISRLDAGSEYEAQLRYLSQIEERNSLAQKIHDKMGHTLAGSVIQLEAAELILEKDREKAGGMIRNVTENLKEGMESIRSTLRSIKPAPEQLGINRLKLMLEEFTLNNRIETSLKYNGSLDAIAHIQWKIIIDNTKEALTNALKYSSATRIDVKLDVMNKLIKAEVRDNGLGSFSYKKGMGLKGMEERVQNAGGNLILDGSGGFSVITLLPAGEAHIGESAGGNAAE